MRSNVNAVEVAPEKLMYTNVTYTTAASLQRTAAMRERRNESSRRCRERAREKRMRTEEDLKMLEAKHEYLNLRLNQLKTAVKHVQACCTKSGCHQIPERSKCFSCG